MTLAFTGSRISEALHLTADRVDLTERVILFENVKKRRTNSYRAVPVPVPVLDASTLYMGSGRRSEPAMAGKTFACGLGAAPRPGDALPR